MIVQEIEIITEIEIERVTEIEIEEGIETEIEALTVKEILHPTTNITLIIKEPAQIPTRAKVCLKEVTLQKPTKVRACLLCPKVSIR